MGATDYLVKLLKESPAADVYESLKSYPSPMAAIYSNADRLKRRLVDALMNPVANAERTAGQIKDNPEAFQNQVMGMAPMGIGAIRGLWHGSPHKFDRFDFSKIGTGEGAQAYGHGGYLADAQEVAQTYQPRDPKLEQILMKKYSEAERRQNYPAMQVYEDYLLHKTPSEVEGVLKDAGYSGTDLAQANAAHEFAKNQYFNQKSGSLYKVDLTWPDPAKEAATPLKAEDFLHWDKPLSEQPSIQRKLLNQDADWSKYASQLDPESRALAEEMVIGSKPVHGDEATGYWQHLINKHPRLDHNEIHDTRWRMNPDQSDGDWLYSVLSGNGAIGSGVRGGGGADLYNSFGGGPAASARLNELGIPGIRYLDGGSRGAGEGSYNYVFFDPAMAQITERNGQQIPAKNQALADALLTK